MRWGVKFLVARFVACPHIKRARISLISVEAYLEAKDEPHVEEVDGPGGGAGQGGVVLFGVGDRGDGEVSGVDGLGVFDQATSTDRPTYLVDLGAALADRGPERVRGAVGEVEVVGLLYIGWCMGVGVGWSVVGPKQAPVVDGRRHGGGAKSIHPSIHYTHIYDGTGGEAKSIHPFIHYTHICTYVPRWCPCSTS